MTSSLLDEDDERREQKPMDRAPSSIVQQARANSICLLRDGSLATFGHASETVDRKDINDGYAVDFRYDILRKKTPWPAQASWRTSAVLAWFSCEGNIHHFFRETLYPIWEQVGVQGHGRTNASAGGRNKQHAPGTTLIIVSGEHARGLWPSQDWEPSCHSERYAWFFSLLKLRPSIFFAHRLRGSTAPYRLVHTREGDVNISADATAANQENGDSRGVCFRSARQVNHGTPTAAFYRSIAKASGVCVQHNRSASQGSVRILAIQRNQTRTILNLAAAVNVLNGLRGVSHVQVVDLAQLTLMEQLSLTCHSHLLIGVQGQGMEWGHFLNGAALDGSAAVLEISYPGWPCMYAELMQQTGIPSICQTHMAEGLTTAKLDSVLLKLNEFGHATQQLVDQVLSSSKHLQSAVI